MLCYVIVPAMQHGCCPKPLLNTSGRDCKQPNQHSKEMLADLPLTRKCSRCHGNGTAITLEDKLTQITYYLDYLDWHSDIFFCQKSLIPTLTIIFSNNNAYCMYRGKLRAWV